MNKVIDTKGSRYPYCVVWTPLPLITALFPFIGHTGICTSEGIIHDFAGSYYVSIDSMAFGNPTKYVKLQETEIWDQGVLQGDISFSNQIHKLCSNNCHDHVAYVLNQMNYQGGKWNSFKIWWLCIYKSKYAGCRGFVKTYLPFSIIVGIIVLIVLLVLNFG